MKEHPYNYDAWFDYVRLEEANGDAEKVRGAMEVKAQTPRRCGKYMSERSLRNLHPWRSEHGEGSCPSGWKEVMAGAGTSTSGSTTLSSRKSLSRTSSERDWSSESSC